MKIEKILRAGELTSLSGLKSYFPEKIADSEIINVLNELEDEGKVVHNSKRALWISASKKELNILAKRGLEL